MTFGIRLDADNGDTFIDIAVETPKGLFSTKVPTDLQRARAGDP